MPIRLKSELVFCCLAIGDGVQSRQKTGVNPRGLREYQGHVSTSKRCTDCLEAHESVTVCVCVWVRHTELLKTRFRHLHVGAAATEVKGKIAVLRYLQFR